MAVIGYMRCSTDKQSLDMQIEALTKAGCTEFFKDFAISGGSTSRPGLDACMASLKAGDVLVVYKLDRLGRSLRHVTDLSDYFEKHGIHFQSLTEGFDTTKPAGKLLFHVIAALAEFERSLITERVNAGLVAAKANGKKFGPKFRIKDEIKTKAIAMHRAGNSFIAIGKELGLSTASAHRVVREHNTQRANPSYFRGEE